MSKKEELLNQFENFLNENLQEERTPNTLASVDNGIRLMESIENIISKEGSNDALVNFVSQYKSALNAGCREEMLYETFTQGLGQFGYLRAVDTELSALKERISKAKQNIDLTKILEMMNNTTSYYIVPLIEQDVVEYMKEKTPNKRVLLQHHLGTFQHDPYVRQMLNCINLDNELPGLMVHESLEYGANSTAHTEKVYSPVQYVRENECIFNVKGSYYVKKGNHISKLSKDMMSSLSESFTALCQLVNDPRVEICDTFINLYHKNDVVKITESEATINDHTPETKESLRNLNEMYIKYDNYDTELYVMSSLLLENFNKIAEIPFVKHIALNESEDLSIDLFKIKNNIFITTHNNVLRQHTFYRNVNPIQCANIINEHLDIQAEALFEDLMPNQNKIKKDIQETKEAYEERLAALKEKKSELESVVSEADDEDTIKKAIEEIDKDIKSTETEYRDWQDEVEKFTDGSEEDQETEGPADKYEPEEDGSAEEIVSIEKEEDDDNDDDNEIPGSVETEDELEQPIEIEQSIEDSPEDHIVEELPTEETPTIEDNTRFRIVNVDFAKNLKTGEQANTGTVIVVEPMVDSDGNLVSETRTIQFYVDNEGKVILNNAGMSAEMYTEILNAIDNDPRKQEINSNAYGADNKGNFNNPMKSVLDKEEPAPAPMEGQAEELPVDFFEEPKPGFGKYLNRSEGQDPLTESKLITNIAGQFQSLNEDKKFFLRKGSVINEEYDNVLNSALEVPEEDPTDDMVDDTPSKEEFVDESDSRSALEQLQQAAESYIDDTDPKAEVTDIVSEDTPFSTIKFFTFTINGNDWAFFEYGDKVYSVQKDAFLDALDACESADEFEDFLKDNEEVEGADTDASTSEILTLLTEVISVETGEQFAFDDSSESENDEDSDVNEGIKVILKKDKKESDGLIDYTGKENLAAAEAEDGSEEEKETEEKIEKETSDEDSKQETSSEESKEDSSEEKNESIELPKIRLKKVNESVSPIPLIPEPNDTVEFKGKRGTVQAVHPDGSLTLMVEGMTVDCSPREVKILTDRIDTMKAPYKFDKKTQAALMEQYVACGIYQSGIRVTANDCYVNYAEYDRKKDYQNVSVINEGSTVLIPKRNIRIFEDVNEFANVDNYVEGVYMNGEQAAQNILINAIDYTDAIAGNEPVRCIINLEENPKVVELPKDSIRTLAV